MMDGRLGGRTQDCVPWEVPLGRIPRWSDTPGSQHLPELNFRNNARPSSVGR